MTNEELIENFKTHQVELRNWPADSNARWQQLDLKAQQLDDRYQNWKAESDARWHSLDQRFLAWKETQVEINTEMSKRQAAIENILLFIAEKSAETELILNRLAEQSEETEIKLNRMIEKV